MLKWLRLVCRQPWTLRWCNCHPGGPLETVLAGQEDEAHRNIRAFPGKKPEQVLCNEVSTAISSTALWGDGQCGHGLENLCSEPFLFLPAPCVLFSFVVLFSDGISCSTGWLQTYYLTKAGLERANLPASCTQVLDSVCMPSHLTPTSYSALFSVPETKHTS